MFQLRRIRVERLPETYRTYLVRYRGDVLGKITFSSYEKHHTGRGWRIACPEHLALERYRYRWQAARRLLREHLHG